MHLEETIASLHRIYSRLSPKVGRDRDAIRHWVHCSNRHLGGESPKDLLGSIDGLETVVNYLSVLDGGS
ncbi:MbcA/ParS/Xre antitoxin family protein [Marinobacter sp.]|uniref:MbcA/ParS/Xre antitoxin family protein n=1 Tax=Marinobacter sp. TaxID=50741 RepID=UPI00384DD032